MIAQPTSAAIKSLGFVDVSSIPLDNRLATSYLIESEKSLNAYLWLQVYISFAENLRYT